MFLKTVSSFGCLKGEFAKFNGVSPWIVGIISSISSSVAECPCAPLSFSQGQFHTSARSHHYPGHQLPNWTWSLCLNDALVYRPPSPPEPPGRSSERNQYQFTPGPSSAFHSEQRAASWWAPPSPLALDGYVFRGGRQRAGEDRFCFQQLPGDCVG